MPSLKVKELPSLSPVRPRESFSLPVAPLISTVLPADVLSEKVISPLEPTSTLISSLAAFWSPLLSVIF